MLNQIRMGIDIAAFGGKRGVGNVAGIYTERCYHISLSGRLQGSSRGLKFYRIFTFSTGESSSSGTKINALVNIYLSRVNAVLAEDIFKYHLGHTALPTAQHILSNQFFPGETVILCAPYKKVSGPLRQLGKIDDGIICLFQMGVNCRFCPHEADIRFSGQKSGHGFICPITGHQIQFNAFFREISLFDCHIHRCVKDRMCHFV